MTSVDDILRRSREARERLTKAGQQYEAQRKQHDKAEARLAEQAARAERAETAKRQRLAAQVALRERRLEGLPTASNTVRQNIFNLLAKYDVYWSEVTAHTRRKHLNLPRMEIYVYLRSLKWSYPKIARFCGREHHSSIMYALRRYDELWGPTNDRR